MPDPEITPAIAQALGYRQERKRLPPGGHGYRRKIFRVSDGVQMYAGPGTGDAYPPQVHPDWRALPRQERIAIRTILDACQDSDELSGIADYLGQRAGQEAMTRETHRCGGELRGSQQQDADALHRMASEATYREIVDGGLPAARARLARAIQQDREHAAVERLLALTGARHPADLLALAVPRDPMSVSILRDRVVWWTAEQGWSIGHGQVPLGLAGLAGLREDGSLGPMPADPWLANAWRGALEQARIRAARAETP